MVTTKLLYLLDEDYNITQAPNPEIGQRWFPLAISHQYYPAFMNDSIRGAHYYVSYQGRMKYINPVYQALVRNGHRDIAVNWLNEFQNFYQSVAVIGLKKIIFSAISEEE